MPRPEVSAAAPEVLEVVPTIFVLEAKARREEEEVLGRRKERRRDEEDDKNEEERVSEAAPTLAAAWAKVKSVAASSRRGPPRSRRNARGRRRRGGGGGGAAPAASGASGLGLKVPTREVPQGEVPHRRLEDDAYLARLEAIEAILDVPRRDVDEDGATTTTTTNTTAHGTGDVFVKGKPKLVTKTHS